MNKLEEICAKKREHIQTSRAQTPYYVMEQRALRAALPRGFLAALQRHISQNRPALIAEIKRASPSKGLIRADFNPGTLAQAYYQGGASCLSVLTDIPYFQGHDQFLMQAKSACPLPALRKDFMLDEYQIIESRALGADCILLIMAALDIHTAQKLETLAMDLGMDVLLEVHNRPELELALSHLSTRLIGINNRNLKTFETSLTVTESLAPLIPKDYIIVCESGIFTHADIARIRAQQVHTFLVGESLMRQKHVANATAQLLNLS